MQRSSSCRVCENVELVLHIGLFLENFFDANQVASCYRDLAVAFREPLQQFRAGYELLETVRTDDFIDNIRSEELGRDISRWQDQDDGYVTD